MRSLIVHSYCIVSNDNQCSSFQTPAARFQEARRDVRLGNNNNNNNNPIRAKKAPSNAVDNKQKQHDNKRVNNQANTGVRHCILIDC
jgi:hypothetical protein